MAQTREFLLACCNLFNSTFIEGRLFTWFLSNYLFKKFINTFYGSSGLGHDDGNNEAIKSNSLSENEDKDHTNIDSISLGIGSNTSITGNTNGKTGGEGGETTAESSGEVFVSLTTLGGGTFLDHEDGNDDTIDTENTCHDNWDDGLEDLVRVNNSEGGDTDTGLGSSVGGSEVGENKGSSDTHVGEELWGSVNGGWI